ncbi:cytochrome c [Seonamhaeicola sp. MEBiC1930]|uniref:c-type cytochrome n=1 Tax=Seonamhaeicola sp. MEBiC01930 TaxID=2976768 RepID=UPI003253DDD1
MKTTLKLITTLLITILLNCGGKEDKKKAGFSYEKRETAVEKDVKGNTSTPPSKQVNFSNKGIGPIKSLTLSKKIDKKMANHGAEIFKKLCTACHRTDKKFIGPALTGILERRSPEWVMNMILNPVEMTQKDPLAKTLLIEFNGAPMPNQSLTEEDSRAILEYFRTLK